MNFPLIFLTLFGSIFAEKFRYDDFKVVQFKVDTNSQLEKILELDGNTREITYLSESPLALKMDLEAVMSPITFAKFTEIAENSGMTYKVTEQNFQRLLDIEKPLRQGKADRFDWTAYYTLEEIYDWLDALKATFPQKVTLLTIGQSYEGRTIRAVKISSRKPGNRAIFIESNIHANEWITSATTTWLINQLLTSTEPAVVDLAENIDWFIMPVFNVDGFTYTHNEERLWRKTRSRHSVICRGVDPNRNFGYNWMLNRGASQIKSSNNYAGPKPFSEPEMQALVDFYSTISNQVDAYIGFHSALTMLLYPYGHSLEPAANADILNDIGRATVDELQRVHGTVYELGSVATTFGSASGSSMDHMYGHFKTPIAFTYEFRDPVHGQILPPEFIIPNSEEVLASLIALVAKTREYGYLGGVAERTK